METGKNPVRIVGGEVALGFESDGPITIQSCLYLEKKKGREEEREGDQEKIRVKRSRREVPLDRGDRTESKVYGGPNLARKREAEVRVRLV